MTTSVLPDDLMLEYDLLQFMESEDTIVSDDGTPVPPVNPGHANFQFLNMDDLLGNAGVVLESLEFHHANHESIGASKPTESNSIVDATVDGSDDPSTLLDDLLINGDELLAHLEKEHAIVSTTTPVTPAQSDVTDTTHVDSPVPHTDDELALTDVDVMSSPCPSMCSETSNGMCMTPPPGSVFERDGTQDTHHISPAGTPSVGLHDADIMPRFTRLPSSDHTMTTEDDNSSEGTEDEGAVDDDMADVEGDDVEESESAIQHKVDLLQKEATYLSAQYDYLVSRAQSTRNARVSVKAKRRAREEQKTAQKTQDYKLLNELVTQQQIYLDNFKAMLAFAPVNDIRMALMTPIESYIHLGKDFDERRRTILSLREDKLDMTYKYIEEKARGINPDQPYQYSDMFERFGKHYSVHFAVSKYEGVEVGQVVKVVYDQLAGNDESLAQAMGCLSIRESYDSIKCNFLHQRIVSSLKWSDEFAEGFPELESNSLFFCRFAGDTAVFATDFIDRDDLHPYHTKDRIRKDVTSGVVLTAHVDADGKRSVVMKRFLMSKFHMYPHNVSEAVTNILFSKMPSVSQKATKIIDAKLLRARDEPYTPCPMSTHSAEQPPLTQQQHA